MDTLITLGLYAAAVDAVLVVIGALVVAAKTWVLPGFRMPGPTVDQIRDRLYREAITPADRRPASGSPRRAVASMSLAHRYPHTL